MSELMDGIKKGMARYTERMGMHPSVLWVTPEAFMELQAEKETLAQMRTCDFSRPAGQGQIFGMTIKVSDKKAEGLYKLGRDDG